MKKVFFWSLLDNFDFQYGFTRRCVERHIANRDTIDSQQAHEIYCMFHGWFGGSLLPEVMGLVSGEVYRLLSEDRCRLGCAAPRPTTRFRLQTLRIPDLL